MKRTEAIEQLQNCIDLIKQDGQDYLDDRDIPLLKMAIEALKEQEISNELQEYAYECGYEHFFHECQNCEYRRIENKADRWIPISEGLPNDDDDVFVTVIDDHGDRPWRYTDIARLCNETWIANNEILFGEVIAWMPQRYPKPYKSDGE